jgi:hypothetical protein
MEEIQSLVYISHIQNKVGWSPVIRFIVVPPRENGEYAPQDSVVFNALHAVIAVIGVTRLHAPLSHLPARRTKFDQY